MTEAFLQIAGKVFPGSDYEVAVDLTIQIYGGPYTIRLASEEGIHLQQVWEAISQKLQEYIGISLPDLSSGPWNKLVGIDSNTTATPTLFIGPAASSGGKTAYLGLELNPPIRIGGPQPVGPFNIVLTPQVTIHAMYLSYADGLQFRLKISTPTTTGPTESNGMLLDATPGEDKFQIVTYPFPIPAQPSGKTKTFDFRYLGLGQRVGPDPVVNVDDPMEAIFQQLESQFTATDPKTILTDLATKFYHPDRNWFIAAHVVIVGWDIKLLFNDPAMYGLRISVPYTPVTFFSGLMFEILYQKLGPNLGVYYAALTLPYLMRRIVLQGIILILPGFAIWIYTNGDFRVNVGWPLGDSSIGIQVGVLMGIAGFYFAKLRSGDNPGVQPSVNYNPILLFGIGLSVYVKQGFSASIFSASIAVSVTATLQGLLAWQADSSTGGPPDHYWFAGTAGLSVLIQGSVDFSILQASVTISLQAVVTAAFETGYSTVLAISASVSVSVSVKVIFFTISLSFSTSINHQFVIGSGPQASFAGPLDPNLAPFGPPKISARHLEARQAARRLMEDFAAHRGPAEAWRAGRRAMLAAAPLTIDLYFLLHTTAVYGEAAPAFECVATLFVEAPEAGVKGPQTPFEQLARAVVRWLYDNYSNPDDSVAVRLETLANELGQGSDPPGPVFGGFNGFAADLKQFLANSIAFQIHGLDSNDHAPYTGPSAVLPMFDSLSLTFPVPGSPNTETIDFSTYNRTPEHYPEAVKFYFDGLSWSGSGPLENERVVRAALLNAEPTGPSMASYLISDYFLLLARQIVAGLSQEAGAYETNAENEFFKRLDTLRTASLDSVHVISGFVAQITGDDALTALMDQYNFASVAGLGSRFLLNGLQLPDPAQTPADPTVENMRSVPTLGLYVLTGAQFPVAAGTTEVTATLGAGATFVAPLRANAPGRLHPGLHLSASAGAPVSSRVDLPPTVPPMPAPKWEIVPTPPPALPPDVVTLSALPPLSAHALYYGLKNQISWTTPATPTARTLLTLPPQLMDLLSSGSNPYLAVTTDPPAEHQKNVRAGANAGEIPAAPALLIRMTLSQVPAEAVGRVTGSGSPATGSPGSQGPRFLPFVYQIGGTDEQTRDLIHLAMGLDLSQATISLLYTSPNSNALESQPLSPSTLVAKINLSTVNQAQSAGPVHMLRMLARNLAPENYATIHDKRNFLQLLWEVSVVNAPGYFLFYEGENGEDLPVAMFENAGTQGNTGEIQVLLEFGSPISPAQLQAGQNCIWIPQAPTAGTFFGAVLNDQNQPVPEWGPTYPAGDIGFEVEWSRTVTGPPPDPDIDSLYQLLQYAVLPEGGYTASNWSLPAGPTQPDQNALSANVRSTEDWIYTKTLPVSGFFGTASPSVKNRYAIMGNPVSTAFRFDDIFGNALPPAETMTVTPLYNDPLIALGEWPGVQVHYLIVPGDLTAARLEVNAIFDPDSLTPQHASPVSSPDAPQGDTAVQQWQAVLDRYDLILDQLLDPNTTVTLNCSLRDTPVIDPVTFQAQLVAFAEAIRVQVQIALAGASPAWGNWSAAEKVNHVFAGALPFSAVKALPNDIAGLSATFLISRDRDLIDSKVIQDLPSVAEVSYVLSPNLDFPVASPGGSPGSASGLAVFAQLFEGAFLGFDGKSGMLKLAQSSGLQVSHESSDLQPLWAVRWSGKDGFSLTFHPDGIVYFALRPLSTKLLTQRSQATGLTYTDVDLDAWAYAFVRAFDNFLEPRNAVAIALLDERNRPTESDEPGYFDRLLKAKSSLAQSIPMGVTNLLQGQFHQGDLEAAKTSLTQSLLTALSSSFTVSTILQAPAAVTTGAPDVASPAALPPRLWGTVGQPSDVNPKSRQYTLSNGEVSLQAGNRWMTVLVSVNDARAQSELQLPLSYQITYLQNGFQKEVDGYVASSWMKFVLDASPELNIPVSATPVSIPIPLPFYPGLPRLVSQSAAAAALVSPVVMSSPGDVESEIEAALRWDYTVNIQHEWAAQDQLFFTVEYNLPPSRKLARFAEPRETLFDALSFFLQEYQAIQGEIPTIAAEAYPGGHTASPGRAEDVIDRFTRASERVASAWSWYWEPLLNANARFEASDTITDSFYLMIEPKTSPVATTVYLFGKTEDGGSPEFWPSVTNAQGATWTPDRSHAVPSESPGLWWKLEHTFVHATEQDFLSIVFEWQDLGVMTRQTALLTAQVVRNANLLYDSSIPTNPDFVYRTAEVKFASPVVPLIQRAALEPINPAKTLHDTIEQLLNPMVRLASNMDPYLRIQVSYEYEVAPGLTASIAVLLADGVRLGQAGSPVPSIARELAEELGVWRDRVGPSIAGAMLVLSMSVFGTVAGDQLPLVQFGRIPVLVSGVPASWWK